jgi:hypothetical protein
LPYSSIPTLRPVVEGRTVDLGIAGLGPATRIGSGGFADVYRAEQTNLRREVAVKVLRASASDDQARMRFQRECYALGAVSSHPNIVAVHEGGFTNDGRAYLVMEFCPGGSLYDRMEQSGPMGADEVIEIGVKIGRALGVAHDAGVLHRDVKPANILVTTYGDPALADFGIARVEGAQQTATGLVTASFAHAAPEVLHGGSPSPASDIYSLGSTMFALFTSRAPYSSPGDDSAWALIHRVTNEPVPDPAAVGMVDPLASTVRRAIARSPEHRFGTAGDLVAALSASPPASTPTTAPTQVQTPSTPATAPTQVQIPIRGSMTPDPAVVATPNPVTTGPAPVVDPTPAAPRRLARKLLIAALFVMMVAGVGAGVFWLSRESLPDLVLEFPAGSTGPLDVGESYGLAVEGGDESSLYRLVVDGQATGEPTSELEPWIAAAGRHSVAVEVTRGDVVEVTNTVEVYTIGTLPPAGLRVNLGSVMAEPDEWSTALRRFDELFEGGHLGLELLPSDRFPSLSPDYWNLYVPGFGEDRAGANAYCEQFSLAVPDECFVSFFDPHA